MRQKCTEYFHHYYPIERDSSLSLNEKKLKIKEWWEKDFSSFVKAGYTKKCFQQMVAESRILFRSGV